MTQMLALRDKVLAGKRLNDAEVLTIAHTEGQDVYELFACVNNIRQFYRKDIVDLCSIKGVISGGCSEDCAFCAQSIDSDADIERYPLRDKEEVLMTALAAKDSGAKRFCLVTGGRAVSDDDLADIAEMVRGISDMGVLPCATLGLLDTDAISMLKQAGLHRYHHNVESSESFFGRICTTHTFKDKLRTIVAVKEAGLSLCSGGIFGLGESWQDRIDMARVIDSIEADSVPINFLTPVKGTAMGNRTTLNPIEALKIISLYRFMLPTREIRICGGRMQTLGQCNSFVFMAGADGLLIGNYLTTRGRLPAEDIELIGALGLRPC
ncbi:biotin synthase [Candidatus Magnetobacterium bavaricum]|uniref:Biotin synthase n=1 Tax=Candidatus Magnetobacterium bavaricum TaxID=29290 RepID=A0A0F3GQ31_9BACT|nr:biotin synthase [Candidatus Magnetobacterium bavaricum]